MVCVNGDQVKDLSTLQNKLSKLEKEAQSVKGQIKKLEYEYKGLSDITPLMSATIRTILPAEVTRLN